MPRREKKKKNYGNKCDNNVNGIWMSCCDPFDGSVCGTEDDMTKRRNLNGFAQPWWVSAVEEILRRRTLFGALSSKSKARNVKLIA